MNSRWLASGRIPPHAILRTFLRGTPRYTAVPLRTSCAQQDFSRVKQTSYIAPSPQGYEPQVSALSIIRSRLQTTYRVD